MPEFIDCMNCGDTIEECECEGCVECGKKDCEHLRRANDLMFLAIASALRTECKKRNELIQEQENAR